MVLFAVCECDPCRRHGELLDCFIRTGWSYFYRFEIIVLQCLEEELVEAELLSSLKIARRWEVFLCEYV